MLITDKFVFIHQPKTGGTFVAQVLNKLHWGRRLSRFVARAPMKLSGKKVKWHQTCNEIPESERGKQIISIVRNPYERYISNYYYRNWGMHPERWPSNIIDELKALYPHFPEVSFDEFVNFANTHLIKRHLKVPPDKTNLGLCSWDFVRFYFKNPDDVCTIIDDAYIEQKKYREDMYNIHFLRTENLNQDLYNFLLSMGYPDRKIRFIQNLDKIQPKSQGKERPNSDWKSYFTPELKKIVRTKEKFILSLFPEYDI
ncbi:MAG: sulfotransferase family protein [Symploca sp. SIO2D2]|nr:sulfotransferase family protein [Symploca sp. SIO2D2]